jgi:trehalose 6-phosphate phosphatase
VSSLPRPATEAGRQALHALLAEPDRALLAVDFDGTLAPIVPRPPQARPLPEAISALGSLAGRLRLVAVISGRSVRDVVALGGLDRIPGLVVAGNYGLERYAAGRFDIPPRPSSLTTVRAELEALLAGAPSGVHLEDKGLALVVHTRTAADPEGALRGLRGPLTSLAARHGLRLQAGRMVLELLSADADKGGTLRRLVEEYRPAALCFAGDDLGDLPAFAALHELDRSGTPGLAVVAASAESPPELLAAADLVVAGPAGIAEFLGALAASLPGKTRT